jgi:protein-disulfide isomerase
MDINEKRSRAAEYARKWREKNRDADREYHRQYYSSHKEQMMKSVRKYEEKLLLTEEGREKLRQISRKCYQNNREKILEKSRQKLIKMREMIPPKKRGSKRTKKTRSP